MVSFSGSINESLSAWTGNEEEFKVFKSWGDSSEKGYLLEDISSFDKYWNNQNDFVNVYSLNEDTINKFIKILPDNYDIESFINNYHVYNKFSYISEHKKVYRTIFPHQENAINSWMENKKGILEMATGTGKTFTAISIINNLLKVEPLLVVIVCPQNYLVSQWYHEIESSLLSQYDETTSILICDSRINWKIKIDNVILRTKIDNKRSAILLTTKNSGSSKVFIDNVKKFNLKKMIIADEVHWLGAKESSKILIDQFEFRLGLSATPSRWFDEKGTRNLMKYFDDIVFRFTIKDALTNINPITRDFFLCQFYYHPVFIELTDDELFDYENLTIKIIKKYNKELKNKDDLSVVDLLLFERAKIIKKAENKIGMLIKLLNEKTYNNIIIYLADNEQLNKVAQLFFQYKYSFSPFTMDEPINVKESIIQSFNEGQITALLAMKCLDEGVDLPKAQNAFLVASSGNPREYIQRLGRVLRHSPGKRESHIYDFIVRPAIRWKDENIKEIEEHIFQKELLRAREIATWALNNTDAIKMLEK